MEPDKKIIFKPISFDISNNCIHHRTSRKQGGQSPVFCFIDMHSRQDGLNLPVDLPGNVIVSVLSTLPLLNSSLWFGDSSFRNETIGERAKLAGDIQTKGAGMPLPEGLN